MPALTITENGERVRLTLGGFAQGEGSSLQEAADDFVPRSSALVIAFRSSGSGCPPELPPDLETMNFLRELGRSPPRAATSESSSSLSQPALLVLAFGAVRLSAVRPDAVEEALAALLLALSLLRLLLRGPLLLLFRDLHLGVAVRLPDEQLSAGPAEDPDDEDDGEENVPGSRDQLLRRRVVDRSRPPGHRSTCRARGRSWPG